MTTIATSAASTARPTTTSHTLSLVLLVLCLAGCEYIPFSGGPLDGTVTPPPATWDAVANVDIVQLESQPSDQYSVNLWVIGEGSHLYVHAGDNLAAWVEHIMVDPRVRMQIGAAIYELAATRVTDAGEFDRFADAWEAKYGNRPGNENVAEAYLYRLVTRK